MKKIEKLLNYARRIRNPVKREYAYSVIFSGPDFPRPSNLSAMAAQAVRMNIAEIKAQPIK